MLFFFAITIPGINRFEKLPKKFEKYQIQNEVIQAKQNDTIDNTVQIKRMFTMRLQIIRVEIVDEKIIRCDYKRFISF